MWSLLNPPNARKWHSATWDPANSQMLVFGGASSQMISFGAASMTLLNDLLSYRPANQTWSWLAPAGPLPPPRRQHSAVWDAANAQLLVFGGRLATFPEAADDLWRYRPAENQWTLVPQASSAPFGRWGHSAVWDPANNRMLVYGGMAGGSALNHLLSYQPATNTWTLLTPAGPAPPARWGHSAAWDAAAGQMLVFGGSPFEGGGSSFNDLWAYQSATNSWQQLIPAGTGPSQPSARVGQAAAWDSTTRQLFVYGGTNDAFNDLADLWAYQAASNSWAALTPPGTTPSARDAASGAWDPTTSQLLLFGGEATQSGPPLRELWSYHPAGGTWSALPFGSEPAPRVGHTADWDPVGAGILVFGGQGFGYFNDLWYYRTATSTWSQILVPGPGPTPRGGHSAIWDPVAGQLFVFGGGGDSGLLGELWRYQANTNAWTLLTPAGPTPTARSGHSAVWIPSSGQMLVFGGSASTGEVNDLWSYRPATNTWTQLAPTGVLPHVRTSHQAAWDATSGQMLVAGGGYCCTSRGLLISLPELWSYQLGSNARVQLAGAPLPPGFSAAWDEAHEQLLAFGGAQAIAFQPLPQLTNDLSSYYRSTNAWSQVIPGNTSPTPRFGQRAVWDPVAARMYMYGGYDLQSFLGEVWRLDGAGVPAPPPTPTATATATLTFTPTRTPTATPTPRTQVGVSVAPSVGGRLLSTITARSGGCAPDNQLVSLHFTQTDNALVTIGSQVDRGGDFTVPVPPNTPAVSFTVRRVSPGPATVQLIVTDGCGTWPTFVGGGPEAF